MKRLPLIAALAGLALPALAANFSGKWAFEVPGRNPNAPRMRQILTLNHVGSEVEGTISSRMDISSGTPRNVEVLGGKVDGDVITFYVWAGLDQPVKVQYKGVMKGDEIEFTVTGTPSMMPGGSGQSAPRQITAKRTK